MNYEKVANSIAHAFATDDLGTFDLAGSIAAALRRAANEAAWDGYSAGIDVAPEFEKSNWRCVDRIEKEMAATYGPKEKRDG